MRRILVLLSVVALMVVMLATSVAPASGAKLWECVNPTNGDQRITFNKTVKENLEADGYVCTKLKKERPQPV